MDDRTKTFVINAIAETPKEAAESLESIKHSRFFAKELSEAMATSGQRVFIVAGLRGTGKTTALYQLLMENADSAAFFSCDELLSREIALEDAMAALDIIKRKKAGLGGKFILLLDEITYLHEWDLKLKVLSDRRPGLIIVATSSSALPLKRGRELARRAYEIHALPLSFREYLAMRYGIKIPDALSREIRKGLDKGLEAEYAKIRAMMGNYSIFGLYEEYMRHDMPFALALSDTAYAKAITRMVRRTIYEDFSKFENFETKMLVAAETLVKYLSAVPADGVSIEKLVEVTGHCRESVEKILDALETAMLIKGVEHQGKNRMYKKPKKWFFTSSSVRYWLAAPVSNIAELTGNLREDTVFRHLRKHETVFYSHEADFIADGLKLEVGKGKKRKPETLRLVMDDEINPDKVPIPLFALSV